MYIVFAVLNLALHI